MKLNVHRWPLILSALLACFAVASRLEGQEVKRPNIVFIFADDQCFNTIRALGGGEAFEPTGTS